jgi:hypothetical protein
MTQQEQEKMFAEINLLIACADMAKTPTEQDALMDEALRLGKILEEALSC